MIELFLCLCLAAIIYILVCRSGPWSDRPSPPILPTGYYVCYRCGNNLEVGVDSSDDLCWHCKRDEEDLF